MMDPEMIRLAQEHMSRIPPDELMRMQQQMMNNPDLVRMATEGMKNLKAEDVRFAAEQMKRLRPEEMAEMSSRVAQASPEELASMRLQAEAQRTYEYQGALTLKNQGNQLHGVGKYIEAAEKYQRAKQNVSGIPTSEAAKLCLVCSVNLMSCYLKTQQYDKAVAEGTEVLENDANNLKALYRRGQAYQGLGKLKSAFTDLSKAAQLAPDDETVEEVLRQVKDELAQRGEEVEDEAFGTRENGPIIEEITEEEAERLTAGVDNSGSCKQEQSPQPEGQTGVLPDTEGFSQTINSLKQNPEMIRSMHSMMNHFNPEQIASMSGGNMTPEMAKIASDMVKQMSPEDMQRMLSMMGNFQRQGVANGSGSSRQTTMRESTSSDRSSSSSGPSVPQSEECGMGLASGSERSDLDHRPGSGPQNLPHLGPEMQEQMRQQMRDPMMKQMMASMVKSLTPETMASMSEQMGFKMSPEEAQQAQKAISNINPDDLEKLMRWADRAQRAWDYARKAKNFLLGRPGLVLAVLILIVAVILHWFGIIGG